MNFAVFALIAVVALWALFGLGRVCCRIFGYQAGNRAETVGIGLAGLVFAGGLLNLFRLSYGAVYDGLLLAGMIVAFMSVSQKDFKTVGAGTVRYWMVLTVLVTTAVWLVGHAELPPSAFNYQDDFEKYFVHPVRMLQTGTVFGSPLSAIGAETLGGQAVLQGILLHHFDIPYLFAVDGLFALLLCMLLVAATVQDRPGRAFLTLLAIFTICFINPLVINVSATYTTSALIMTALSVCYSLYRGHAGCSRRSTLPWLLGMLFAALIALKTINAVYLAAVFVTAAIVQRSGSGKEGRWAGLPGVFVTGAATLLLVAPWLLVHISNYLGSASASLDGARFASALEPYREPLKLLSFKQLFYGSSYAHYTLLTLATALYCFTFYGMSRRRGPNNHGSRGWLFACGMALPISSAVILALGPQLNGYFANIRYTTPYLIAGSSLLLPIALRDVALKDGRKAVFCIAGLVACGIGVLALFSGGFVSRIRQADNFGNSLAFSALATGPEYLAYNREVLYGSGAERMHKIQGTVPSGTSVLAWVTTPFQLDYSRNLIYDVEQAGTGNPWAHLPKSNYVIYQYAGYAVPPIDDIYEDLRHPGRRERQVGQNALAVIDAIEKLWDGSPELYNDGEIVVFRVAGTGSR